MKRSSRLIIAAIAALVLTQTLAGCIPIGIKGQSLPWAGTATPGAAATPGASAIAAVRAST